MSPVHVNKIDGSLVGKDIKKVRVSTEWNEEERAELRLLLAQELERLKLYAEEMRKTCLWKAPYFATNAAKCRELEQMIVILKSWPSQQIEMNRGNFSSYIE